MKYDFETLVSRRGTGAAKWGAVEDKPDYIVPLSVADMEFQNAPEIREGLKEFIDGAILGYTGPTDDYYEAIQNWMETRHGFRPEREWFIPTAGVVPAIVKMVPIYTKPEDAVLIMEPVYHPFRMAIEKANRTVVSSDLVPTGNTYELDWEDFEAKAAREDVTLMIFCSPHNPVGKIWTREELDRICEICLKYNVFIISDEIHFDLIMPGYEHVSFGVLDEKYQKNCAICTAPSKTFNLAALQTSNIFIPDEERRAQVKDGGMYTSLTVFGYKACEYAYARAGAWLDELLQVLDTNKHLVEDFLKENLPQITVCELQGTYLMWMNFKALGMEQKELDTFLKEKAGWYTGSGLDFGEPGEGFERLNIALPTWVLKDALDRLKKAIDEL